MKKYRGGVFRGNDKKKQKLGIGTAGMLRGLFSKNVELLSGSAGFGFLCHVKMWFWK